MDVYNGCTSWIENNFLDTFSVFFFCVMISHWLTVLKHKILSQILIKKQLDWFGKCHALMHICNFSKNYQHLLSFVLQCEGWCWSSVIRQQFRCLFWSDYKHSLWRGPGSAVQPTLSKGVALLPAAASECDTRVSNLFATTATCD